MRITFVPVLLALVQPAYAGWLDPGSVNVDLNSEDNHLSLYGGLTNQTEWLLNNGAKSQIRIKGYDEPSAVKWDLSACKGLVIEDAELHLQGSNEKPSYI